MAMLTMGDESVCICTVATDDGRKYIENQARLLASLETHGYRGNVLYYAGLPPHCPSHSEQMYHFKPVCVTEAFRLGFNLVIWLDASVYANKPLDPFVDAIWLRGSQFFYTGNPLGEWCNSECRALMGVTSAEDRLPEITTAAWGFVNTAKNRQMVAEWAGWSMLGAFNGKRWDENAHRHDQTVMSLVFHRHGLASVGHPKQDGLYCYGAHNKGETTSVLVNWGN